MEPVNLETPLSSEFNGSRRGRHCGAFPFRDARRVGSTEATSSQLTSVSPDRSTEDAVAMHIDKERADA
jgi:hypothetical protein